MAICTFILRRCQNQKQLEVKANRWGDNLNCSILFPSQCFWGDGLILSNDDVFFEIVDRPWESDCSVFLSYDSYTINGVAADHPLRERLDCLQELSCICAQYAESVEIYLGEDSLYLPDYAECVIPYSAIAETIWRQYNADQHTAILPCLHLLPYT